MKKMTKDTVPEGFTLTLALVDALPVLFFGASMIAAGLLFSNIIFMLGAFLCLFAGAAKVLWKIIVVLKRKNIWWLFIQMRILMPIGMLMMIASLVLNPGGADYGGLLSSALSFPPVLFFALGIAGMLLMIIFAFRLDSSDPKANWTEQLTNGAAQLAFFIGLLLMIMNR